ncbi:MAG: hypothetical protein GEU90_06055 [Gemmatimonas sp.]|nr:hypothetical protein [Gemmatimonas sp.]
MTDQPPGMVSDDGSAPGMAGVPIDGPMMDLGGPMMDRMLQHMDSVAQMSGDSLRAAPDHRRMVGSMINRMTEEMGRLTMGASPGWTRLMESVRDDWERLPELDKEEFESFMSGHLERLRRLMDTHRELMAEMHM